ncbi:NAD(P)-binding protein [Calocera cornea HHB12733]|uniref:NAD(P)-binding protein n=1 Tax=Calocera cornea HHB12733 TaxID=1353952 RepID=A0A165EQF5_9BASI|nr:NAD(P)-binding protein [Calocera cornea HHB12733]
MAEERRLVVVVTGANSGVGLGICKRIILQMAGALPPLDTPTSGDDVSSADSLTLILACRNKKRAAAAKEKCLQLLEKSGDPNGFGKRLRIEPADLDLCNMQNVWNFCRTMKQKYGYITHLFLNAGTGNFVAVNWPLCAWQILTEGYTALMYPRFKVQGLGAMTDDGYGLVWQSNVLGHFMMVRLLTGLLAASPYHDARVIWTSSMEADLGNFDPDDWQLFKNKSPYEATKYQQELISFCMDDQFARSEATRHVRSLVAEPGICASAIYTETLGWFLDKAMIFAFYLCRWVGSAAHVVDPFKGAVPAIYLALVAVCLLPVVGEPTRWGARTNWLGREYPAGVQLKNWDMQKAKDLTAKCDRLCESLMQKFEHEGSDAVSNGFAKPNGNGKA